MPCYSPLFGYKSKKLNDNGKRKLVFTRQSGLVDLQVTVPCGKCIGCRIDKSRQWAIRCTHEAKMHKHNCFVTFTYDDENLPPDLGLQKTDLQNLFKKIRYHYHDFRYYACGEYGDQLGRPHYHVLFFGLYFDDRKKHSQTKQGNTLYTSPKLTELWGKGHCFIADFSYATAAYTARYVMKKQYGKDAGQSEAYTRVSTDGELYQVPQEFALMSRRPGIGSGWYDKFKSDAFPSDFLVHEGKKHPVPRFYLSKLEKESEDESKKIKYARKKASRATASDNTPDRLYSREQCKKAQVKQLTRSL